MASLMPGDCIDVVDIQFKLQSKVKAFQNDLFGNKSSNLLATASTLGLVFSGLPTAELQVMQLQSLESSDDGKLKTAPRRVFPLPSPAFELAINCDNSLLAVDILVNGIPFLYIYRVDSFLTNNVQKLTEIRISPNENVHCTQILWNPVINNMFALVTESGGLCVYHIQEKSIEFHSIDKSEVAQSACWSPKGKQIVVGFTGGRLVQYKQDLKPAKTIPCPSNIVDGAFDVIALQWLSTYQFATVFLKKEEGSVPALHIINAPKTASVSYINYDDICYSQSGPRKTQVFLLYIQQWNMLLMASANSMEVGVLGTVESGETPSWCQWVMTDNARAELPLTSDKQETFPIGFVLETGCTKRLIIGETEFPLMPMIHMLSTHGELLSFSALNLKPTYVDICSPPRPISPAVQALFVEPVFEREQVLQVPVETQQPVSVPVATSTPQVPKTKSFFSPVESKSATSLFGTGNASMASVFGISQPQAGATAAPTLSFGGGGDGKSSIFESDSKPLFKPTATPASTAPLAFGNMAAVKPTTTVVAQPQPKESVNTKPLITVPSTYTPTMATQQQSSQADAKPEPTPKTAVKSEEDNKIIRIMIAEELQLIERDLKNLLLRSKDFNHDIGSNEESSKMIKTLDGLQDWGEEALENTATLSADIQQLRLGINETFQMVAEAKSKFAMFHDTNQLQFQEAQAMSLTNKRQVIRLKNTLALNETQVHMIDRQINAQWVIYEDNLRMNSKNRMHIPNLEGVYQTLSKLQEIIQAQVIKLSQIKKRIGMKENVNTIRKQNLSKKDNLIESLTDSLISMSIADQVVTDTSKLSLDKLQQIKDALAGRKIIVIKPTRPNRPGLNSEVVKERLLKSNMATKKNTATAPTKKDATTKPKKVEETTKLAAPVPVAAAPAKPAPVVSTQPAFGKPITAFKTPTTTAPSLFQIKPVASSADLPKPTATTGVGTVFGAPTSAPSLSFGLPKPSSTLSFGSPAPASSLSFGTSTAAPSLSFGSMTTASSGLSFGAPTKSIVEPSISFGNTAKTAQPSSISFGLLSKPEEPAKTTAAPLSFGSGLTMTAIPSIPKTPTDFSFAAISASTAPTSKPVEIVTPAEPLFGDFEAMAVKPVTSSPPSYFGSLSQANKPELVVVTPVKEKQPLMVINPVAVKKTEEVAASMTAPTIQNKENSAPLLPTPVATEKQPLMSMLLAKPLAVEPQSPPTIASPTVVSSAEIKKPIATTSSFSFGAAFSAATAAPPAATSTSASFSFVPTAQSVAAPPVASTFSFANAVAADKPQSQLLAAEATGVSAAQPDSLFQGFNICTPHSSAATTASSTSSLFGSSLSFGAKPEATTTSIFGGGGFGSPAQATTPSATSFFGSMSVSAVPSTESTTSNIFGLPKPEQSVFGTPSTPFAQATPQATSIFGGGASNSSPFGGSAFSSPLGSNSSSIFGGGNNQQPAASGGSIFGTASAFNSPTTGGSIFGNNATGADSAATGGSIFGGNANQAPAFGAAPTFGSPVGFGGQPAFGAPATFGAPPTFGSPSGFGGAGLSGGLSSPTQGNSLFEQLGASSQGNLFGNLANQNANENKPVFGGQQFSSWR